MNRPNGYINYVCPFCRQNVYSVPAAGQSYYYAAANPITIKKVERKLNTPYVQSDLQIPVVDGSINPDIKNFINNSFENDIMEFYNQLNSAGRQLGRTSPYIISNIYRVTYNRNNILSLAMLYREYDQRNLAYIKAPYNFNIATGESLGLRNIFKPGINYVQLVNNEIRKLPGQQNFPGIASDQPYYIDGDNLVVFLKFNPIAPTEDQLPTVNIPMSRFRNYIRPEYLE